MLQLLPLRCKAGNATVPASLSLSLPALGAPSSRLWGQQREEGAPLCSSCPPGQFPFPWAAVLNPCSQRRELKRGLLTPGEVLKAPAPVQSKSLMFIYHYLYSFFLCWLCFPLKVSVVAVLQGVRAGHVHQDLLGREGLCWDRGCTPDLSAGEGRAAAGAGLRAQGIPRALCVQG